ncbi:MAG: ATP-binding protein [Campylobacter sp.]|nr:ATP-binding protein [Campylobacter sp.]
MQEIINFINQNPKDSKIQKILEVSDDEIKILQFLLKNYLDGNPQSSVFSLLCAVFGEKDYNYLNYLKNVKSLIDLGLVTQISSVFKNVELGKKTALLSLLNSEIEPSEYFLKILEDGEIKFDLPQILPYNDNLEYLKDQFFRINLYAKKLHASSELSINKIDERIKNLEKIIAKRIRLTKISLPIEQIFKSNSLNSKEQLIFLALLKEEYSAEFENFRDLNTLIALISEDEISRFKNRALLEEGANLILSGLIDYDETIGGFGGIMRSFYINEDILQTIMHPKSGKKNKKALIETIVKESEIFELIEPVTDIDDVVLNEKTKELLSQILKQVDKKVINRLNSWGIKSRKGVDAKIIFYGAPGTGKTMSALSLAKSLKKQVISFDCSKILSKYVGESEQNVRKIFDTYNKIKNESKTEPVLLLNEADQFLSSRIEAAGGGSDKMHNQMQNIFLDQIEKFEGVLIATTNLLKNIDTAFSRRFDYKIEFKKPTMSERLAIWRKILPENASFEENFSVEKLAEFELSGAQIVMTMKNTALKVAVKDDGIFTFEDFANEIKREISSNFDTDKKVGLL